MKPEEKAKELIKKFNKAFWMDEEDKEVAKACALICVQELINSYKKNKELDSSLIPVYNFWQQVKEEINNL